MINCVLIFSCLMQGPNAVDLKLYRFDKTQHGTFGELIVGNARFKTVERLYANNEPFISSVPPGVYTLEPHISRRHGKTWALVNHELGVYHWKDAKAKRYAILIHIANRAGELAGCIGLGKYLGFVRGEIAVTNSSMAVSDALDILSHEKVHTLEIIDATGG